MAKLKNRAKDAGRPVIYVNDNFGLWRSDAGGRLSDHAVGSIAIGSLTEGELKICEELALVLLPQTI